MYISIQRCYKFVVCKPPPYTKPDESKNLQSKRNINTQFKQFKLGSVLKQACSLAGCSHIFSDTTASAHIEHKLRIREV